MLSALVYLILHAYWTDTQREIHSVSKDCGRCVDLRDIIDKVGSQKVTNKKLMNLITTIKMYRAKRNTY